MAWTPKYANRAGMIPVLQNAKAIVERDIGEALAWAFGGGVPGDVFKRIQFTQRHSAEYPLLIIQAATDTPSELGTGGLLEKHVFDVEIFLTREISVSSNFADEVDALAEDLIRYYDATVMAFLSASASDWTASFPGGGVDAGKIRVFCTNAVFGQLQQAREVASKYLHSVAFELQVSLIESE
jgi:hypothetical protein